jgi:hypothetical protein
MRDNTLARPSELVKETASQKRNRHIAYVIHRHLPQALQAELPTSKENLRRMQKDNRKSSEPKHNLPRLVLLDFLPPSSESVSRQDDSLHTAHWFISRLMGWRHVQLVVVEGNGLGGRWGRYQGWAWDFSQGGWTASSLAQASESTSISTAWKHSEHSGLLCLGWTDKSVREVTHLGM